MWARWVSSLASLARAKSVTRAVNVGLVAVISTAFTSVAAFEAAAGTTSSLTHKNVRKIKGHSTPSRLKTQIKGRA